MVSVLCCARCEQQRFDRDGGAWLRIIADRRHPPMRCSSKRVTRRRRGGIDTNHLPGNGPASPARPLLRFAALAQPRMINDTIVAEMDALWTPPAGGPLMTRATARERAALLRRSPSRPSRAAHCERAQPAQQVHQAGRPVRPSPAAAGVPAVGS